MGYRHYFYMIPNEKVEEFKTITMQDFHKKYGEKEDAEEEYVALYNLFDEVFEFGKLYWDDTAEQIYKLGQPMFGNKELQDRYDDYIPYIVGRDAVLKAIEIYKDKIRNYLTNLTEQKDGEFEDKNTPEDKMREDVRSRLSWLAHKIDEKEERKYIVTGSWLYEDGIFNLAHILKTIDWHKNSLMFMGW